MNMFDSSQQYAPVFIKKRWAFFWPNNIVLVWIQEGKILVRTKPPTELIAMAYPIWRDLFLRNF